MKVVLFCPPMHPQLEGDAMRVVPPLGVYIIGAKLRQAGHQVTVYDHQTLRNYFSDAWDEQAIHSMINDADAVGISSNSFSWGLAKKMIEIIKSCRYPPFVFCGGIHPTFYGTYIMESTETDAVIIDEGEENTVQLINAIENGISLSDIPNIMYRENGKIMETKACCFHEFEDYGLDYYDMLPENIYFNVPVETSRGCRFRCAFCSILDAHNWRGLSVKKSIERIEYASGYIGKKSIFNCIYFVDNCFTADIKRATDILRHICNTPQKYTLQFEARCTDILGGNHFLDVLDPTRVSSIQMGIECGYDLGLKLIKKGLTVQQINKCLAVMHEHDLAKKTLLTFMIGFPWEKREDCLRTIEYALDIEQKYNAVIGINWWLPLKSSLTDNSVKYGFDFDYKMYDDPLWTMRREYISKAYAGLDLKDISYICEKYTGSVTSLVDMI